jgi:hypothetical protein
MSLETVMSLRQRGFFITPDGRLLAKEGELFVETARGLLYTLRFGDIVSAPAAAEAAKAAAAEQDRYLFVTVSYDPARAAKYGDGAADGERLARTLMQKFADWYYVISGKDFAKLHPRG